MAVLIRLVLLAAVAGAVFYLVKKLLESNSRGRQTQVRIMPYCPKCESNRHVVANAGTDPIHPRERAAWYCKRCEEGF